MSIKQDLRDVLLGKELLALCGSRISEDLLKARLAYIQRKTGLLKDCSISDFADLCDLSKNPKCVEDSFVEEEEKKEDDVEDLLGDMASLSLDGASRSRDLSLAEPKYVRQSASMTMAKCQPRPPYKWTSASKALGIPKGYCEKDVNYQPPRSVKRGEKKLKYDAKDLDTSLNECDICLGTDLNGKGTVPLKCGHYFHKECLTGVQNCPICRSPVEYASPEEVLKEELRNVLLGSEIMKECRAGRVPKESLKYRLKYLQRYHDAFKSCNEDDFAEMCDLKKDPSSQCKSSILTYVQGKDMESESEQLNSCGICMLETDETGKGTVSTTCGHYFHEGCINRWFRQSGNKCPTCRQFSRVVGQ